MTDTRYDGVQVPSSRPPEPPYRTMSSQPTQAVNAETVPINVPDTSGVDVAGEVAETRSFDPVGSSYSYNDKTETMPPSAAPQQTYQRPRNTRPAKTATRSGGGGKSFLFGFLGALLACLLAFGVAGWGFGLFNGSSTKASSTDLGAGSSSVINTKSEDITLPEAVAAKALPSVVYIGVYQSQQAYGYYYGQGDQGSQALEQTALGSGIILSEDGYILTNYHVVEGAQALKITAEGTEYDAEVVGTDPSSDLAVVKAKDASGLVAADIGNSDNLVAGEWVMSVGCPFGLEESVATGVVSATSRSRVVENNTTDMYGFSYGTSEPTLYPNMIQTDAAINPGNSGGALVDADGKVIGVNTLIASYSGNYSGVGFAIPINYAINIANQIIDGKTPTHAKLGVSLTNVTSAIAKRYNLSSDYGSYVSEVSVGSGAEAAGIQAGDIIIAMDGQKLTTATDLTLAIRGHNPGDTVTITVNRNGETLDLQATLGSDEEQLAAVSGGQQDQGYGGNGYGYGYGGNGNGYGGEGNGNGYGYGYGDEGGNGQGMTYEELLRYLGLL